MAFNYFSKQLIDTDKINLSEVFPEKQQVAKDKQRVSYGLEDVVMYIRDATEDFKFYDPKYAELDNGVRDIIDKYYKSTGATNPFDKYAPKAGKTPEYKKGIVPKEPYVVDAKGETVTAKGVTAPKGEFKEGEAPPMTAPFRSKDETEAKVQEITQETADAVLMAKLDRFKKELDNRQLLIDDYVESNELTEKDDLIRSYTNTAAGLKDLIEDEMADDFDRKRYELLTEFIQKNA